MGGSDAVKCDQMMLNRGVWGREGRRERPDRPGGRCAACVL